MHIHEYLATRMWGMGRMILIRDCNTLQHTATDCYALQHTAMHCNTLQLDALSSSKLATHCNTLLNTVTHCNTLQWDAWSSSKFYSFHRIWLPFIIRICDVTRSHVRHDAFTHVLWLDYIWDTTHTNVTWHEYIHTYV